MQEHASHIRVDDDRVRGGVRAVGGGNRTAGAPLLGVAGAVLIGDLGGRDRVQAGAQAGVVHHVEHAAHTGGLRSRCGVGLGGAQPVADGVVEVQDAGGAALQPHLLLEAAHAHAVAQAQRPGLEVDQHLRHHEEVYRG
ncbi:MAG TPA: hypothetical protein VF495_23795 [Phenylobacterium sp.]